MAYGSMTNTFATTGSTTHSTVVSGLSSGNAYQFYVRCADTAGNANSDDFVLAFSIASTVRDHQQLRRGGKPADRGRHVGRARRVGQTCKRIMAPMRSV